MNVVIDPNANGFLNVYIRFQSELFPELDLRTKFTSNGYLTGFGTGVPNSIICHKIDRGDVGLHFWNTADKMEFVREIAKWLNTHGMPGVHAVKAEKSATLRMDVSSMALKGGPDAFDEENASRYLSAIRELSCFAATVARVANLADGSTGDGK